MEKEDEVRRPARAQNPSLLPLLASPHRVTAPLQLQLCPPLPAPDPKGCGGGGRRF